MKRKASNSLKIEILELIRLYLENKGESTFNDELSLYKQIGTPPKWENGQLALPMFHLSKILKMKPVELASDFCEFANDKKSSHFEKIENLGPYTNFHINFSSFASNFLKNIESKEFFKKELFSETLKTMIEYSQPNTHKELHVGHMRNLCLGNSIVNLLRFSGVEVIAATYPGDVGTHVAKTLWFLKKNNLEAPSENKGAWLGEQYSKANALLEEQRGSELEAKNREELTAILKKLKTQTGEYYDLWKETRQWSISLMKHFYTWADVDFEHWFFESEVDKPSLKLVDEYLEKGFFKVDDGAVGIDLSDHKLGFFMVKKSDGNGLYSTKDLELARKKFQDFKIEKSIYIVDERQSLHFKQVFKTLELMGFEQAKLCEHLSYAFVELTSGAMSSRKGIVITLDSLIQQMEKTIQERYLEKYKDEWESEKIQSVSKMIANGAIKYGMCRIDSQKKIIFDMDEWLRLDGNSGPYLQYTYARIRSICDKAESINPEYAKNLSSDKEGKLLFKMNSFHDVIQEASLKYSPSLLCNYLYDLCQDFNSFYADHPIMNQEESVKHARLYLIDNFSEVLKEGLSLLGISCPTRM